MAPIHVCVTYDKPTPEYYAGELLSGNVIVTLEKSFQINDVYIKIKGKGEVEFTRTEGSGDNKRTVRYHSKEVYINHKAMIYQTNCAETFGTGQNRFPFSLILPTTLPESFHISTGEVKYKCKAVVKCAERVHFLSSTCKESTPFIVHAIAPIPDHLLGMQNNREVKNLPFCCDACCCFSSGKVSGALTINKGGYIPGETISFNAQISNKTSQNLESIVLSIKQTIMCIASGGKADTTHNEINKVACTQGIRAGEDYTWPVSLTLPYALPPTNLGSCRIITVSYMLEADIGEESGCCAPDVHFRIPFTVGSAAPAMMAPSAPTNMMVAAQRPNVYAGFPQPLDPGYPPAQPYMPQPGGYPLPQPDQPMQPGFPPSQPGYQPSQPGYPQSQPGYSSSQPGYPPSQPGYPPSQPGYSPSKQPGFATMQPYQSGYSQPIQQQMDGFAPSCPTVITDEPTVLKQEHISLKESPKM